MRQAWPPSSPAAKASYGMRNNSLEVGRGRLSQGRCRVARLFLGPFRCGGHGRVRVDGGAGIARQRCACAPMRGRKQSGPWRWSLTMERPGWRWDYRRRRSIGREREALLVQGIAADPNFEPIVMMEGRLLWAVGRGKDALAWLKRAHELNPLHNGETMVAGVEPGGAGPSGGKPGDCRTDGASMAGSPLDQGCAFLDERHLRRDR